MLKSYLKSNLFSLLNESLFKPAVLHSYSLSFFAIPIILEPEIAILSIG